MKHTSILLCIALAACQNAGALPPTAAIPDAQAFATAKQAVLNHLKDPASAKFVGAMSRHQTIDSFGAMEDVVCGAVNAKNSYGGYTGPRIFAFRMVKGILTIDGDTGLEAAAGTAWCRQ